MCVRLQMKKWWLWIIGVFLVVAIMMGGLATCGGATPPVGLDFSATRPASQIPTSKENDWDEGYISLRDLNVSVKFSGGRNYHGHVFSISFHRTDGQVNSVMIDFDKGSISETYSLACKIAGEWGLPASLILTIGIR